MSKAKIGTEFPELFKLLQAPIAPEDVDWKCARVYQAGGKDMAEALAYADARAIQCRLDAVLGPEGWRAVYEHWSTGGPGEGGATMCHLELRMPDGTWVRKSNAADESDIEGTKGGISNAFKRVAVGDWGIGRQLYDLPRQSCAVKTFVGRDGKPRFSSWLTKPSFPDWYLKEYEAARKAFATIYSDTSKGKAATVVANEDVKLTVREVEPLNQEIVKLGGVANPEAGYEPPPVPPGDYDLMEPTPKAADVAQSLAGAVDLPDWWGEPLGFGKKEIEGGVVNVLPWRAVAASPKGRQYLRWVANQMETTNPKYAATDEERRYRARESLAIQQRLNEASDLSVQATAPPVANRQSQPIVPPGQGAMAKRLREKGAAAAAPSPEDFVAKVKAAAEKMGATLEDARAVAREQFGADLEKLDAKQQTLVLKELGAAA